LPVLKKGIEVGQVGLRLVTKGERQTIVVEGWNIGASSIAYGRWHTIIVTIDVETREVTTYLNVNFVIYQSRIPFWVDKGIS